MLFTDTLHLVGPWVIVERLINQALFLRTIVELTQCSLTSYSDQIANCLLDTSSENVHQFMTAPKLIMVHVVDNEHF